MTQRLSAAAFGLCNTEDFQRWIDRQRGQLDSDPVAQQKFEALQSRYRRSFIEAHA